MGYLHIILWKKLVCAKKVTKLPDLTVNESIYFSKSCSVSEFGKVEVTSTPVESSFFRALALLRL